MASTRVRTCTATDRRRASLEASLNRFLTRAVEQEQTLPAPPVGGQIVGEGSGRP